MYVLVISQIPNWDTAKALQTELAGGFIILFLFFLCIKMQITDLFYSNEKSGLI